MALVCFRTIKTQPSSQTFHSQKVFLLYESKTDHVFSDYLIALHLSEIANYFAIITISKRLYLIQRRSKIAVKLTRNERDYCHGYI